MSGNTTYDPKGLTVTITGNDPVSGNPVIPLGNLSGFSEDNAIDISYNEDAYNFAVGVDGECARARSNNNSATITVHLFQTSKSNGVLSGLLFADNNVLSPNTGQFSIVIKDSNNNIFSSLNCTVIKGADITYTGEITERAWTINAPNLTYANVGRLP